MRAARVRFRPHHFLCALGYQGKGYSDRFTANMSAIVLGRLRAPDGGRTIIEVTGATDDICAPCPKRRGDHCMSQVQIAALDSRHAAALGLAPGDRLTWAEAQVRIRHRVHADDLDRLCRGCGWLALGLCKAALRSLTGPTDRDTAP
ncbi:MAG: DUF1284 domain-containing protein [Rhodobacteraceae bacterium]|nr:DUF1284 domain-containing protein [Paracoccaceae bacterium]